MAMLETVELLAETVARQAKLITKLCGIVEQLNAVTSLEGEIAEVKALAANALEKGGR